LRGRRPNPTILIDATDIDRPSGARTAVYELLREMVQQEPTWEFRVLLSVAEPELRFPNVRQIIVPVRNRVLERIWVQVVVTALALTRSVDLVHFARTLGGIAWPVPSVLTVFDLTTIVHPELYGVAARLYWRRVVPTLLRAADAIIAISENVRNDLVQQYHFPRERVTVIYCAPQSVFDIRVSPERLVEIRDKFQLPEKYLLFVGLLARKKNLSTLIRAIHLQAINGQTQHLVLAGRKYSQSDDAAILDLVDELGLRTLVHYIGPVPAEDLPGLYAGASMLVFPSLHEGFGIPCVEAMKCGVPVVAARSGAIPEVVGDSALLIDDPTDPKAFVDAIQRLSSEKALREELIQRGLTLASRYSWPRIAEATLALYKSCLKSP